MPARVVTVPILEDNYAYLVICQETQAAAAVDPADAKAVLAAAAREGATISHVLTTHSHWDHAGGNKDMVLAPSFRSPTSFSQCISPPLSSSDPAFFPRISFPRTCLLLLPPSLVSFLGFLVLVFLPTVLVIA